MIVKKRIVASDGIIVKSKYERDVYEKNPSLVYEPTRFPYVQHHMYTPDFRLPNGVYIETKGYFRPGDKGKLLRVKKQHPQERIHILLMHGRPAEVAWCEKQGFTYAIGLVVPPSWYV